VGAEANLWHVFRAIQPNGAGVICYLGTGADGKSIPLKAVANGDGTYSLLVA
jgi:hypothetical protein